MDQVNRLRRSDNEIENRQQSVLRQEKSKKIQRKTDLRQLQEKIQNAAVGTRLTTKRSLEKEITKRKTDKTGIVLRHFNILIDSPILSILQTV